MRIVSHLSSSAPITPSLSLTLAPPSTPTNGCFGSSSSAGEHLDLAEQQAAARARQDRRRADDRRVRPVRRAERLVHVGVDHLAQRRPRARGSFSVSPGSKRRFSSIITSPGPRLAAIDAAVGADHLRRERRPRGRAARRAAPRPAPSRTAGRPCPSAGRGARTRRPRRPARAATASVGSTVAMRRSSSTRPSRSGTLKSARSSTRAPCSFGRSSRRGRSTVMERRPRPDQRSPMKPTRSISRFE